MSLRPELYRELLRLAGRYSRRAAEAEELTHDVLVEALRLGITDWESVTRRLWLRGALRRHAAFLARCAARRRRREESYAREQAFSNEPQHRAPSAPKRAPSPPTTPVQELPPSLRSVAVLLAAGLSRRETRFVLGISEVALRQRLTQLRKRWPLPELETFHPEDGELAGGKLRQALLQSIGKDPRLLLGTHDPDGHLLLFGLSAARPRPQKIDAEVLTRRPGAATPFSTSLPREGAKKDTSC